MEDIVQDLEKKWAQVQENALKQPTPGIQYHMSFNCSAFFSFLERKRGAMGIIL